MIYYTVQLPCQSFLFRMTSATPHALMSSSFKFFFLWELEKVRRPMITHYRCGDADENKLAKQSRSASCYYGAVQSVLAKALPEVFISRRSRKCKTSEWSIVSRVSDHYLRLYICCRNRRWVHGEFISLVCLNMLFHSNIYRLASNACLMYMYFSSLNYLGYHNDH